MCLFLFLDRFGLFCFGLLCFWSLIFKYTNFIVLMVFMCNSRLFYSFFSFRFTTLIWRTVFLLLDFPNIILFIPFRFFIFFMLRIRYLFVSFFFWKNIFNSLVFINMHDVMTEYCTNDLCSVLIFIVFLLRSFQNEQKTFLIFFSFSNKKTCKKYM